MIRKIALIAAAIGTPAYSQQDPRLPEPTEYELQQARTAKAAMRWEIGYQVLSAIDGAMTIYAIESGKAEEANPLFGKKPKAGTIIAAKVLGGALHFYLVREVTKKNPKLGLRIAQISVVGQGTVVGLNARFVF